MLDLIERSAALVSIAIEQHRNPALLVSFGKDSMAMLHLLRHYHLPVICHTTPYQKHKWEFAIKMAAQMGLIVHSFPPEWNALKEVDGELYVLSGYTSGSTSKRVIAQRTAPPTERLVCGLHDVLRQPKGQITSPWDLLICAQKTGDPGVGGIMEIDSDLVQSGDGVDTLFPMRGWSDKDIFNYTMANNIPFQTERYIADHEAGIFRDREDTTGNPDVVDACFACINKKTGKTVKCPRLHGATISNISDKVPYLDHDNNHLQ